MPVIFYLFCSTAMAWFCLPGPRVWMGMFVLTIAWAVVASYITLFGLLFIMVMSAVGCAALQTTGARRQLLMMLTGLIGLLLAMHKLPGFTDIALPELSVFTGTESKPFYLHLDKAIAGLVMLAVFCRDDASRRGAIWRNPGLWRLILTSLTGVFIIAVGIGLTLPQWKWSASAWAFLGVNLFFTCLAEEAFFRGGVQQGLLSLLPKHRWFCIGIAALLFGLAHAWGGWRLIVVATLAGVGYGRIYERSGAIAMAIILHFLVNAIHFVGFVYPAISY
ncbi:lysostaphin resistance A-like protein [Undibacterium sp. Xuan67W]|uniref:CPBP family intramembrane glutamic endopeptidase n=1 Tax=Undibacterium sp. Xuan67W TaxID=3413057 RepID=UPI003BF11114